MMWEDSGENCKFGLEFVRSEGIRVVAVVPEAARGILIVFNSHVTRPGQFEFSNTLQHCSWHRVFLKEERPAWYHNGICAQVCDIDKMLVVVREECKRLQATAAVPLHVRCCGLSSGGYMALLAGCLLPSDSVVAFAPQTAISAEFEAEILRKRYPLTSCLAVHGVPPHRSSGYDDLRTLASRIPANTRLVVGRLNILDQHYASSLVEHCRHIVVDNVETDRHVVTSALTSAEIVDYCCGKCSM